MASPRPYRPLIIIAVPLAGILLLVAVYYLSHVGHRERYFTDRNLRALSVLREQIEGQIHGFKSAVHNAAQKAVDSACVQQCSLDDQGQSSATKSQQACVDCRALFKKSPQTQNPPGADLQENFNDTFRAAIALVPKLKHLDSEAAEKIPCSIDKDGTGICARPKPAKGRQTSTARLGATAAGEGSVAHISTSVVYFCDDTHTDACGTVELTELLEPLITKSPLENLDLFLADDQGTILFNWASSSLRLVRLPSRRDSDAVSKSSDGKDASSASKIPPTVEDLQQSTSVRDVSFHDADYKLFAQPIRLSISEKLSISDGDKLPVSEKAADYKLSRPPTWIIGALLRSDRFAEEARAVSFMTASLVPLFVLMALLALPVLKVFTMGPRDRLTALNVHVVSISIVFMTGLATALLLDWYAYSSLTKDIDAAMHAFSADLRRRFGEEVRNAHNTLRWFTDERRKEPPWRWRTGLHGHLLCTNILNSRETECAAEGSFRDPGGEMEETAALMFDNAPAFRDFQMIFLTDINGQQREKWTTKETTTPVLKVDTRSYFRDAKEGRLLRFPAPPGSDGAPPVELAVNLVTSWNTGETLVALSIPIHGSEENRTSEENGIVGVATMIPHLTSLVDPVVPPGRGFAVIENDGRVLFHSNPRLRLYENLFAESDQDNVLRSTIFARRAGTVRLLYHGRLHRMYVHPIEDTPWSLIVFRDREMLRTVNFEILSTCVLWFTLYVAAYALGIITIRRLWPHDRGDWICPNRNRTGVYYQSVVFLVAVAAWFGWAIYEHEGVELLAAAVAVPFFTLAVLFLKFSAGHDMPPVCRGLTYGLLTLSGGGLLVSAVIVDDAAGTAGLVVIGVLAALLCTNSLDSRIERVSQKLGSGRDQMPRAYVGCALVLLIVVAVLPSTAISKDAFMHSVETLVRLRQFQLAEVLAARSERTAETDQRSPQYWLLDAALESNLAACEPCNPFSAERDPATPCPGAGARLGGVGSWFTPMITALLPVYSPEALALRNMIYHRSSDRRWQWMRASQCAGLMLVDERVAPSPEDIGGSGTQTVLARIPAFPKPSGPLSGFLLVALLMVVLGGAFQLLRTLANRIFGLNVEVEEPSPDGIRECAIGWFLLRPHRDVVANLKQVALTIDFETFDRRRAWKTQLRGLSSITTCVLIDHLEYRLDESEWNTEKLALLEELILRRGNPVIVASEVDPPSYFRRRMQSPSDLASEENYATTEERDRWARVLSLLRKVRTDLPDRRPRAEGGLNTILVHECRWTPRLRGIEEEIRQDPRWQGLTNEELIRHIGDLAEAHYRTLWSTCTNEERLVLVHLANDRFVSPKNWNIVYRLVHRHLIKRAPAFRVMNESFAWFASTVEGAAQIAAWEQAGGASTWNRMRNILLVALLVAGVFLFVTQPDVLTKWLAFLAAMGAGAGGLVRLLSSFQRVQIKGASVS